MKKIIFQNPDNSIGIIHPTNEGRDLGMINLGKKDTPKDLPFWVVEEETIPSDRTNRDAWELDGTQGEPGGHGE